MTDHSHAASPQVLRALDELRAGRLVVVPTDTVYGIAGDARRQDAVDAIFRAKGRTPDKALPVLGGSVADLEQVVVFDDRALRLAEAFWPGPLTLVLPRAEPFTTRLGAVTDATVAVRIPDGRLIASLLGRSGPLAVTSANISGREPARAVSQARAVFGEDVSVYLDDGPSAGSPSTILSLVGEALILREGDLGAAQLFARIAAPLKVLLNPGTCF